MDREIWRVSGKNFDSVILGSTLPFVALFAIQSESPGGPLGRSLNRLHEKYGDRIRIGVVDISQSLDLALRQGIQDAPVFAIYDAGFLRERLPAGYPRLDVLYEAVERYI